jgi:hypothetical protein
MILEGKSKICIFSLQYKTFISLNQGQGSIFKLRDCAQSVPRIKLPQKDDFEARNPKCFDFRFNTHIYFSESGSRKHFHVSGMRAIDFSPRNYPKKSVFRRKSGKKFFALKRSSTLIFRVKLNFSRSENARNRFFA